MNNTLIHLGQLSVAASLLLSPALADAAPPDLCDELVVNEAGDIYTDVAGAGISRWCEPRTDPPAWAAPVCCVVTDEANCTPTNSRGRCDAGMTFWCDYGERIGDGVACYQPGPGACASGFCVDEVDSPNGPTLSVEHIWLCCEDLGADVNCVLSGVGGPGGSCSGFLAICEWGMTNLDGTVDCYY